MSEACTSGKAWETLHKLFTSALVALYLGTPLCFGKDQAEFRLDLNRSGQTTLLGTGLGSPLELGIAAQGADPLARRPFLAGNWGCPWADDEAW